MTTTIDALKIRRALGRYTWGVPRPFGPDGWMIDHNLIKGRIIVTMSPFDDDVEYLHASMAFENRLPEYDELALMHRAVFPGYAYQVFAPPESHVNIHGNALHLWGRADGKPILPEFGDMGTI